MQNTLKKLYAEKEELQRKLNELIEWLTDHPGHADFMKVVDVRNVTSVKLYTCKEKIKNLEADRPINGYEIGDYLLNNNINKK